MDEAHPGKEVADAISECIKQFIWTNNNEQGSQRSVRGPKEHTRTRFDNEIRRTEREVISNGKTGKTRAREKVRRKRSNETGARGR